MNHANLGARYIQVGSSAGPTSTINAPAFRNKLLTLVGHGQAGTPAEVRRSAYAQLMRHATDGKLTLDLEQTRLDDISQAREKVPASVQSTASAVLACLNSSGKNASSRSSQIPAR